MATVKIHKRNNLSSNTIIAINSAQKAQREQNAMQNKTSNKREQVFAICAQSTTTLYEC